MNGKILKCGWVALAVCIVGLLGGCGGGGSEGTTASASSEGPIAGFGSVIMNGDRWNTDDARFEIEGRAGTQADLDIGMIVRVEGRRSGNGSNRADRVIFSSRLRGPIRAIEELGPDTRALTLFGIRALVSRADTHFRDTSLDDLVLDQMVELSGLTNADGDVEVSHLRDRGVAAVGVSEVKVFGEVMGLAGGSFILGTSEILFDDDTRIEDLGPAGLEDGIEVRVQGILLANDAVDAQEIRPMRRGDRDDDFDEVEIHGVVRDFNSIADFMVAGRSVDASSARFFPNDPDLLRDGVRVEVEGRIGEGGVLIAEKVKFRSFRVRIHAQVASDDDVNASEGLLSLLGISIHVDERTRAREQRGRPDGFGLADVVAGDFLEIRGIARPDGTVMATHLVRDRLNDIRLRGPVDMIDTDEQEFTILGVLIRTDSGTRFETDEGGVLSAAEFFDRVEAGWVVQARDRQDGDEADFDVADKVELERPDLEDRDDDDGEEDDDPDDDDDEDDGSDDD